MQARIFQPEKVEFDQFGQWSHSAIHSLDEKYDEVPYSEIPELADNLEMHVIRIWDEDKIDLLHGPNEGPADFRKWQPEAPDEGEGWFPFQFSDDENGPYVAYARNRCECTYWARTVEMMAADHHPRCRAAGGK
jgi:hypothetical protein